MRDVELEIIYDLAIGVNGRWYPAKQPFIAALGLGSQEANSRTALRHLIRLGFPKHDRAVEGPLPANPGAEPSRAIAQDVRRTALAMAIEAAKARGGSTTEEDEFAAAEEYATWIAAE